MKYDVNEHRNNIRNYIESGVVKSLRLLTAEDGFECVECKKISTREYFLKSNDDVRFVMDNMHVKHCKSNRGCLCIWKPENISIDD